MSNGNYNPGDSKEEATDSSDPSFSKQRSPDQIKPTNPQDKPADHNKTRLFIRIWRIHRKRQQRVSPPNVAEKITVFLILVTAAIGGIQARIYYQQKKIMESSGQQMDQLIEASEIQASASRRIAEAARRQGYAAGRFADSADSINTQTQAAVNEFHRLADASENTVKANLDIARLEQRPWIIAGINIPAIEADKPLPAGSLNVLNSGRTFAKNVIIESYASFSPIIPTEVPKQVPPVTEKSVSVVAPNITYSNPINWPSTTLSLKQIYPLMSVTNDWYIVTWGTVTYEDVFKAPGHHTTSFCAYRKLSDPGQPLQCAFGNDAN
jgi:hypothetical protein